MGSGGGPAQPARPGLELPRVGGRRDLRTPQPSPQAPRARMHAGPPGQWGVLEAPRAPGPGQALAALVLAVFGGGGPASAGWSPVAGRAAQVQHAPRREVRPVGPTCRAERKGGEAQGS